MKLSGMSFRVEGDVSYIVQCFRARLEEIAAANPGLPLKVRVTADAMTPKKLSPGRDGKDPR